MQKKTIFSIGFVGFLLVASLLLVKKQPSAIPAEKNSTCCKKPLQGCSGSTTEKAEPPTILENLSRQFIAIPNLLY